jgi:hypothetical protein
MALYAHMVKKRGVNKDACIDLLNYRSIDGLKGVPAIAREYQERPRKNHQNALQ